MCTRRGFLSALFGLSCRPGQANLNLCGPAGHGNWGCHQCSCTCRDDRCGSACCCHRPRQGSNPAADCPAGGKVQKANPGPTVMIPEHGNDRRHHVDAEHEAKHDVENDQNTDAIGKAFHFHSPVQVCVLLPATWRDSRPRVRLGSKASARWRLLLACHAQGIPEAYRRLPRIGSAVLAVGRAKRRSSRSTGARPGCRYLRSSVSWR